MKPVLLALCIVASISAAQGTLTFTGVLTDDMCPLGDHGRMKMGANDAECAKACIDAHGASWVLYDGKSAYVLSDQKTPEKFAARKVRVIYHPTGGKAIEATIAGMLSGGSSSNVRIFRGSGSKKGWGKAKEAGTRPSDDNG